MLPFTPCLPLLTLPQVRAYWNVKGDVRSGSWQGIMRGYYAASLLTQRQVGVGC